MNEQDPESKDPRAPVDLQELQQRLDLEMRRRESAEQAHRAIECCWHTMMESVNDVIYMVLPDGTIAFLNSAFESITGWSAAEFLGQPMESLLHPDDAPLARKFHQQLVAGHPVPIHELRVRTRSDQFLVGECSAVLLEHAEGLRVLGIARDVTERRRADQLVRQQLSFERVVAAITGQFLHDRPRQIEGWIDESLRNIAELFGADGAGFGRISLREKTFDRFHHWLSDASQSGAWEQKRRSTKVAQLADHLAREGELVFRNLQEFPPWSEERELLSAAGIEAAAVTTLNLDHECLHWSAVVSRTSREWSPHIFWRLRFLGQLLASVTSLDEAEKKLRAEQQLLRKLLDIQERDRQLIAHEVHDGFLQYALVAHMHLQAASKTLAFLEATDRQSIDKATELLSRAIAEARRLLTGLRPVVLERAGVLPALHDLVAEFKTHGDLYVAFTSDTRFERLDPDLENTLYRIVQEGLNNVKRHSHTNHAAVRLLQTGDQLRIEIRDQGTGFDPAQVPLGRFGLRGIRERARLFGGRAVITSAPGKGTRIQVDLPLTFTTNGLTPRE